MRNLIWLSLCFVLFSTMVYAEHYNVVLLGGQSNMDGRAPGADLPTSPVDLQAAQTDVLLYHGDAYGNAYLPADTWIDLEPGSGSQNASARQFGPEITFGRSMADADTSRNFALIKYARGGTSLSTDWDPSTGSQYTLFQDLVADGLAVLTAQGDTYEIIGMLWMQGESDDTEAEANAYQSNLTDFIADVRGRYGDNLPFVIGETWRNAGDSTHPGTLGDIVSAAQQAVADLDPYASFVSTRSSTWQDEFHLDAAGQMALGYGMADAMWQHISSVDAGDDMVTWSGQGVDLSPAYDVGYTPTEWAWSADPNTGVVFSAADIESPTVMITKVTENPSSVLLTLMTSDGVASMQDTLTIDVYDTACKAAIGKGLAAENPTDFDGNCITDINDFAELALAWLISNELDAPQPK